MVVVENKKLQLDNFLSREEINRLGSPENVISKPEAKIAEWDDTMLLITGARSLATYSDKFKGPQSPLNERYLSGFEQEFSKNGEVVAFADEELSEEIGDTAVSNFAEIEGNFVTDIRDPEEAWEAIEEYREIYPGEWDKLGEDLEENRIVYPAIYTPTENYDSTGVAMRTLDGVQANDSLDINRLLEDEAEELRTRNLSGRRIEKKEAPKSHEAEYFIDIEPEEGEEVEYGVRSGSIIVKFGEDDVTTKRIIGASKLLEEDINNGVYSLSVG